MPSIQGRTRLQIREAIGYNVHGMELITAAASGSTTTFLSDMLWGGADDHNGKWWVGTDTPNAGVYARVKDSSITSDRTTLTLFPAVTSTLAADTAELWAMRFDPKMVEEFINQAIIEVTGLVYDPEESVALFADGRQSRYDIPTQFAMLNGVELRSKVESKRIHAATADWDEGGAVTGVTRSLDSKDYKSPPKALKFAILSTAAAGAILGSKAITSLNISGYDYVEFWIKSTIATAAGDLKLHLDDTALVASALEILSVPALVADTWAYVRISLANPELDTAIISIGLEYDVDIGACTIWINDIKAVKDDSSVWVSLDNRSWRVDELNRDLILTNGGRLQAGYRLMKLKGGDKPALLSADSTACEIDDQFVIARSTELTLIAGGPSAQNEAGIREWQAQITYWHNQAEAAKRSLPLLVGARTVG